MKELFKQWLINQNSDFINANEEETETLQEWLDAFIQTVSVFVA